MGEARRRREAECSCASSTEHDTDVGPLPAQDVPNRDSQVRVTMLDDDECGCVIFYPADKVTELLEEIGEEPYGDRGSTLREAAASTVMWAEIRNDAFNMARSRDPKQAQGAGLLGLWCAMNGPQGSAARQMLSDALAAAGHAGIVMRRDRATRAVATVIGQSTEPNDVEVGGEMALLGGSLPPEGAIVVFPDKDPRPQEH